MWPRHWRYHYRSAKEAAEHLAQLHEAVLRIEPGDNNARLVADEALLEDMYRTGSTLVSDTVRAVQHLAEEIERACRRKLSGQTVEQRVKEALRLFSSKDYTNEPDYSGLSEINSIRDALEHPQGNNTYNDKDWDCVPLAWMFSNRSIDAWTKFDSWFSRVALDGKNISRKPLNRRRWLSSAGSSHGCR